MTPLQAKALDLVAKHPGIDGNSFAHKMRPHLEGKRHFRDQGATRWGCGYLQPLVNRGWLAKKTYMVHYGGAEYTITSAGNSALADLAMEWLNRPYVWPIIDGYRLPQGDCSACRQIDKRHPEGSACDFSCVGV